MGHLPSVPTVTRVALGVLFQCCHALFDADAQAVALHTAPCVTQLCSIPAELPRMRDVVSKSDNIDAVTQFTHSQLLLFVAAYKDSIASVHQDGGVIATDIQYNAPWALDRIDQDILPLNGQYSYFSTGSNVNVYIIDTVRHLQLL